MRPRSFSDLVYLLVQNQYTSARGVSSNSPKFILPKVVQKQRAKSYRVVFVFLYRLADPHGLFELDAQAIVKALGISERAVYYSLRFLKRVNLLTLEKSGRGRGNRSIYKLNWLKSASLSIKDIKTLSLRKDKTVQRRKGFNVGWGKKLKAFRELLQRTFLTPREIRLCCGVIGRYLKNKPIESCRQIYHGLAGRTSKWQLEPPNWVVQIQDLCRWFMGILKRVSTESF